MKNNELKSQLVFAFNKVDKFNLPIPPAEVNVATLILITSSIGCLIIGGGLLGYFIYYDRKHHVVKKWWEKRKKSK